VAAILAGISALYAIAALTPLHEAIQIAMGHGAEMIVACIFLHRALGGEQVHPRAERPAYAFARIFILLDDLRLAAGLIASPERRVEYEHAKGGGAWMDLSQIARRFFATDLTLAASLLLIGTLSIPILCFVVHRRRQASRPGLEAG
jgi:hypothetical protein